MIKLSGSRVLKDFFTERGLHSLSAVLVSYSLKNLKFEVYNHLSFQF